MGLAVSHCMAIFLSVERLARAELLSWLRSQFSLRHQVANLVAAIRCFATPSLLLAIVILASGIGIRQRVLFLVLWLEARASRFPTATSMFTTTPYKPNQPSLITDQSSERNQLPLVSISEPVHPLKTPPNAQVSKCLPMFQSSLSRCSSLVNTTCLLVSSISPARKTSSNIA